MGMARAASATAAASTNVVAVIGRSAAMPARQESAEGEEPRDCLLESMYSIGAGAGAGAGLVSGSGLGLGAGLGLGLGLGLRAPRQEKTGHLPG